MRILVLAGVFTAAAIPLASVAEAAVDCQVEDARPVAQVRIDGGGAGGSAPARSARQTSAPREAAAEQTVQRDAEARAAAERRRNGKRIPDAELIGPRGAL